MNANQQTKTRKTATGVDASLARPGGLSYLEIPAIDARRSASFYEKVLGWKAHGKDGDVWKFSDQTGHLIGRWLTDRAVSREGGLLPYFYVDGVEQAAKRAAELGGEIVKAPYPEGNLRVAVVRDPAGNVIGLWQEIGP